MMLGEDSDMFAFTWQPPWHRQYPVPLAGVGASERILPPAAADAACEAHNIQVAYRRPEASCVTKKFNA